jgi:aldose 1-epimerase
MRLPFGFGFHPWFVRSRQAWLKAPATTVWLEDVRHLPAGGVPVGERPDWDFATLRPLPEGWINNGFEGWNGVAQIDWRDRGLSVAIFADRRLSTCLGYSPSASAGFLCFEPVSHPVDAHGPGERVETSCRLAPERKHLHAESH